jgi:cytochrome c biogenesis factor
MVDQYSEKNPAARGALFLWDLLVSPTAFVFLAIAWCLDLGLGSLRAFKADPQFWMKMDSVPFSQWLKESAPQLWPNSLWVYILVGLTWLMVLSLLLCTANWFFRRRKRYRGMGEVLVHLGFLLVFAGYVLGSGWGTRVQDIKLGEGMETDVPALGLRLKVNDISVTRDQRGNDLDTVSTLTLTDASGAVQKEGTARLNHPLINGSTVVYPNGSTPGAKVKVTVEGVGQLEIGQGARTKIRDGLYLSIRGFLQEGGRWGKWVGPGVFLTLHGEGDKSFMTSYLGVSPSLRTAKFGDDKLTLEGIEETENAVFSVHHDPGIQLVLLGALILTLGTFWALYGYLARTGPND